jgi:sugar lactone lactonase YvrE
MKIRPFIAVLTILITAVSCKKGSSPGGSSGKTPGEKTWVVTTVAGDGEASFVNGPASSATFHFPFDVAVAADGTLYVADALNNCIRKVSGGQVSTFAGSGFGIVNGSNNSAEFKYPFSVILDAAGNVYSTDVADPRVRKITSAGVSTYAGADEEGFLDGDADTAQFREEIAIAADTAGNIYMADAQNNRIRKISVSGKVSTVAGSNTAGFREGSGGTAQFNFPDGIVVDKQGNLYVSDASNSRIRKITPDGRVSTFAGSGISGHEDGDAGIARFDYPMDMVIDSAGNLYVLDISRIRKVSPEGAVSTIAGSTDGYVDGDGSTAKFYTPAGLGIDAQGNIYVADTNNNRIRKISFQ